jgi:hypothetical protein
VTDYTKSTGSSGTMMIRDTGTYVEFWLKAGSATYNYQLPWSYVVNGVTSPTKEFRFEKGGQYQKLGSWNVSTSQTVTFKIGDTGTSGLGGPTTFSQAISRAKAPNPPSAVSLTNVTGTNLLATFSDGANNGAAIDDRQIGFGTSTVSVQHTVSSDRSTTIIGLAPGTTYYFWARTHNSKGWSAWGPRSVTTTLRPPSAPSAPLISGVTPTSANVSWSPPNNGGTAITGYQVGYGTSSTGPTTTVDASSPKTITGLIPGTKYYFWVRAKNSQGWSPWSNSSTNTTVAGARIKVGTVWKVAVPYVKVNGVWKVARPWVRVAGVWKEAG